MENKKKYIIISPLFPSDESHTGSYVYDQVKTIIDLSDYNVKVIKVTSIFIPNIIPVVGMPFYVPYIR